jgi:KipI family sensor histidine kinase inhibitor
MVKRMKHVPPPFPRMSHLGISAVLFESTQALNHTVQQILWAVAEQAPDWTGVKEVVPGMNNLMLIFDPQATNAATLQQQLHTVWSSPVTDKTNPRTITIPVIYGGEEGVDLKDIAANAGLSLEEAAAMHAEPTYTVYFLGAHPGFAYLAGLNPKLHTPRRVEPRLKVSAGTVAIGGPQTGVNAQTLPSGWNLIGKTELSFFDPKLQPPTLLAPGDQVRFIVAGVAP